MLRGSDAVDPGWTLPSQRMHLWPMLHLFPKPLPNGDNSHSDSARPSRLRMSRLRRASGSRMRQSCPTNLRMPGNRERPDQHANDGNDYCRDRECGIANWPSAHCARLTGAESGTKMPMSCNVWGARWRHEAIIGITPRCRHVPAIDTTSVDAASTEWAYRVENRPLRAMWAFGPGRRSGENSKCT